MISTSPTCSLALAATVVVALCLPPLLGACSDDEPSSGGSPDTTPDAASFDGAYTIGAYTLLVAGVDEGGTPRLALAPTDEPERVLWQTAADQPFVVAAEVETTYVEGAGALAIEETPVRRCDALSVETVAAEEGGVTITGRLTGDGCDTGLTLVVAPDGERGVGLRLRLDESDAALNRVTLSYASDPDEHFFGFGEQFTVLDMKGESVTIVVREQGIGRGEPNFTPVVETLAPGASGDRFSSYAPVPHYITTANRSLYLEGTALSTFDLTDESSVSVTTFDTELRAVVLDGTSALDLIEQYTARVGRMPALPDWVDNGAIIGMQGGTQEVRDALALLQSLETPIAAFWLQDWVGNRETILGKQLWWNWQLNEARYPGWDDLVSDLADLDIRVLTYVNCFLVDTSALDFFDRNLFAEAEEGGFLVADAAGEPILVPNSDFSAGILNLTNGDAVDWFKDVLRDEVLAVGASGWMADFGESLPFDAALASGEDPALYHNQYPVDWARLNRELLAEEGLEGEALFFTRAGFTGSLAHSTLFWAGDQNVSWDVYDGIQSMVIALLSSGFSGFSLNHSDIGGYTTLAAGDIVLLTRTEELIMRWMEANAFTAIYRTHDGSNPELNAQFDANATVAEHFATFAKTYAALAFYRRELFAEAEERGWPVVRHLVLHYPDDPEVVGLTRQWLLGDELLVAPVLDEGATSVDVYLPAGTWVHVWSGDEYGSAEAGTWVTVEAPLGQPPVFYGVGSQVGATFVANLQDAGLL